MSEEELDIDDIQEEQIREATEIGVSDQDALSESDSYTWREDDPTDLATDEEDDMEDYCDECAALLNRDGTCSNNNCVTVPCPVCGPSCKCPPMSPGEAMAARVERQRADHAKALTEAANRRLFGEAPSVRFPSPEAFDEHLTQKRAERSTSERRSKAADQYDAPVRKYGR